MITLMTAHNGLSSLKYNPSTDTWHVVFCTTIGDYTNSELAIADFLYLADADHREEF